MMPITGPGDDRVPRIVKAVKPVYPLSLRLNVTEGEAIVAFIVDTTGRVRATRVERATHPAFGERAVAAVEQWVFMPAMKDGRPVNVRMRVPVVFNLPDVVLEKTQN